MEVRLKPFNFAQAVARAGLGVNGQPLAGASSATGAQSAKATGATGAAGAVSGGGFQASLTDALKSVSASQNEVNRLQREVQLGNPTVSLEETMVAMQKSQIGFQATVAVRNKLVQAYTDIMNMQV